MPAIAVAQVTPITNPTGYTFAQWVNSIVAIFNSLIALLGSIAIVIFFIGLLRFIFKSDDARGRAAGRSMILWGLVSLFVLFTLGGIIQFVKSNLGL
jgi:hypothetical protein